MTFFLLYVVIPTCSFWTVSFSSNGKATEVVLVIFAWISHWTASVIYIWMVREVSCQTRALNSVIVWIFFLFCKNIRKKFRDISFTNMRCMCLMQTKICQLHFVINVISFYGILTGLESRKKLADNIILYMWKAFSLDFFSRQTFQIKMEKIIIVDSMNRI